MRPGYWREYRARALEGMRADPADPRHGTHAGYSYGCRCPRCKMAEAAYKRVTWGAREPAERGWRRWTRGELRMLRRNYGEVRCRELARWLGRSPGAVQAKARKLGLRSPLVRGAA